MLFNTDLFITANKFKRFLGPEDGRGTSRNEQLRNLISEKLQKLKELLAKLLRSRKNQSEPTISEIKLNELKSPNEIMTAILSEIKNPQPNIMLLGKAICAMEVYLVKDSYSNEAIMRNIAAINGWLYHMTITNKPENSAFSQELMGDAVFLTNILKVLQN